MKKTTTKKTVKKTVEPEFIMNCVDNTTPSELCCEVVNAKVRAGKTITTEDVNLIKSNVMAETLDATSDIIKRSVESLPCTNIEIKRGETLVFDANGNYTVKRPNLFKRFWNWISGK